MSVLLTKDLQEIADGLLEELSDIQGSRHDRLRIMHIKLLQVIREMRRADAVAPAALLPRTPWRKPNSNPNMRTL